jgi:peptide/nickel transport system substrate-binding protein
MEQPPKDNSAQPQDARLAQAVTHLQAGRMNRRNFLVYAAMLGVSATTASALAACAPTAEPAAPAAGATAAPAAEGAAASGPSGTLRVAWEIPVQLDPALASSDSEISIINSVYDYLVDIDSGSNIQPRLATDWTMSEDGLTYTFTLAEGVTFHDGSPLTGEDVVWTFDRLRDPDSGFPTADLYTNIADVSATGDLEVQFTLTQTNPFFLYDLSDNHAVVVKADAADLGTNFNGTGPFRVVDYSPENRMDLEANPDYFI